MCDLNKLLRSINLVNPVVFKQCIEDFDISINTLDQDDTPIFITFINNYISYIKSTLDQSDDESDNFISKVDQSENYLIMLNLFFSHNVNVNLTDKNRHTPLMLICMEELTDSRLTSLFDRLVNSNPEAVDNYGKTALIYACTNGLYHFASSLIRTGKSNPSQVDIIGMTALKHAINKGLTQIAIRLIETGESNPEHVDNNGNTALIYAAEIGLDQVVLKLLENGNSKPEHVDNYGKTALITSIVNDHDNIALKLIETGQSRPDQIDDNNSTALIYAIAKKLLNVSLELIDSGQSRPDHIDSDGNTALILACVNGDRDVSLKLIETGQSRPEHVDNKGWTALMYAIVNQLSNVSLKLIETGQSRPDIKSGNDTPLNLACQFGLPNVAIQLLLTDKANLHYTTSESIVDCAKDFFEQDDYDQFISTYDLVTGHKSIQQMQHRQRLDVLFQEFTDSVNRKRKDSLFNQVYQTCINQPELTPTNRKIPIDNVYDLVTSYDLNDTDDQKSLKSVIKLGNTCYTAPYLYDWWSNKTKMGKKFTAPDTRNIVSDEKRQEILQKYRQYSDRPQIDEPVREIPPLDNRYQLRFIEDQNQLTRDPFQFTKVVITDNDNELINLGYIPNIEESGSAWNSNAVLALIQELWDNRMLLSNHNTDNIECCTIHLSKPKEYWFTDAIPKLQSMHEELTDQLL